VSPLNEEEVRHRLQAFPNWTLSAGAIRREFSFPSFIEAFGWMSSVALVAQAMDHHPDWTNVFNRVSVSLSTHDALGLTAKDFTLAAQMDRLFAK
jgi:4a-hydroxytetrahydrobiopterin dehydratase